MTVSVGGLNIGIGVDYSKAIQGLKGLQKEVVTFNQNMKNIRLEGIIKGNPFAAVNKYIKESGKELDKVFDIWSKKMAVRTPETKMIDSFAADARKNVANLLNAMAPVEKKFDAIKNKIESTNKSLNELGNTKVIDKDIASLQKMLGVLNKLSSTKGVTHGSLLQSYFTGGASGLIKEQSSISEIMGSKFTGISSNLLTKDITKFISGLKEISPKTKEAFINFSKAVSEGANASDQQILIAMNKLILSLQNKKKGMITESMSLIKTLPKLEKKLAEASKAYYGFKTDIAGSYTKQQNAETALAVRTKLDGIKTESQVLKENKARMVDLIVAEKNLRLEMSQGSRVRENQVALMKNLEERLNMGRKLTPKLTAELNYLRKTLEKPIKETTGGFLSREWFISRIGWFLQLRGYWLAYRGAGEVLRSVTEYQVQLSRAVRAAESDIMSATDVVKAYSSAMKAAVGKHGATWEQTGETLYQLGSAGLKAEEAIAALDSTMSLLIGTEGDAQDVTKLVAGVYNNFADQITNVTSISDKFLYINNVLAEVWKVHQIEIGELVSGFSYLAASGKLANLSFKDMAVMLGVLNDNLIKGSKAGTELRNVLLQIAKEPAKFAKQFGIEIDQFAPMDFINIMDQLKKKMGDGKITVVEMAVAFERLGIRGISSFEVLLENWEEVREEMERTGKSVTEAMDIENTLLDNLSGQWKKLWGEIKSYVTEASALYDVMKKITGAGATQMSEAGGKRRFKELIEEYESQKTEEDKSKFKEKLTSEDIQVLRSNREYGGIGATTSYLTKKAAFGGGGLSPLLSGMFLGPEPFATSKTSIVDELVGATGGGPIVRGKITEPGKGVLAPDLKKKEEEVKAMLAKIDSETGLLSTDTANAFKEYTEEKDNLANMISLYSSKSEEEIKSLFSAEGEDKTTLGAAAIAALAAIDEQTEKVTEAKKKYTSALLKEREAEADNIELNLKSLNQQKSLEEDKLKNGKVNIEAENKIKQLNSDIIKQTVELNSVLKKQDELKGLSPELVKKNADIRKGELETTVKAQGKESTDRYIEILQLQMSINSEKQKSLKNDIEELKVGKETEEQNNKILEKETEYSNLGRENINIQDNINGLNEMNLEYRELQKKAAEETIDAQDRANKAQRDYDNENLRIKKEEEQLEVRLLELALAQKEAELVGDNEEILRIKREILNVENESYSKMKELTSDQTKIKNYEDKIKDNKTESLDLIEEELKYSNSLLYVYKQLVKEAQSFQEAKVSWISKAYTEGASGLATVLQNSTGGFQEQRQEAAELKVELKELKEEYDEAISEGNAERVVEITDEMKNLRTQIDELEDPIENLKDAFKSFFKDLVDSIRQAINEWIAMQVVMGIAKAVGSTSSTTSGTEGLGITTAATGGVLPKITAFRKFSSGGMTNAPSLAVLGDNASGKEIVIPEENIKSNSVSGYVRNQGSTPIYIANVIRETDAPRLLSGPSGKNTIVNYVIDDIHSKGPIYRKLKTG